MGLDGVDVKSCVVEAMQIILGYNDHSTIKAATKCIQKDMDRKSTIDQMRKIIDGSARKFVDEIYEQIKKKKKNKRKGRDSDEVAKKTRRFEEPSEDDPKVTDKQITAMMASAKQQIAERQKKLGHPRLYDSERLKAQKAEELKQRIQAQFSRSDLLNKITTASYQMIPKIDPSNMMPKPLILDDQGRTVDSKGQLLQIPSRVPTLKANIRAKKQEEFRQKLQEKPAAPAQESAPAGNKYFDYRVKQESQARGKRHFKFYEKGRFEKIAEKMRKKSLLDKLQSDISQAAKRTGIQQASKLALIVPKLTDVDADIPFIEWWDSYVYDINEINGEITVNSEAITNLIEHPIQIESPGAGASGQSVLQTFLTKKERKKIRRMNRREALKDEQEKIRLGLIPAPEPKVKLSNLMRVLGTEAVQDPTKMEQYVRRQMEKRKRAHEQANAARKLTKEERKQKRIKKLKEDTSRVVHVSIYKVRTLRDPAKKFKVEKNSKQLYLTGCALMHPSLNLVVVEGGPKSQRKFKRLMLNRIKWEEDKKGKRIEEDSNDEITWCEVLWCGETKKRNFGELNCKQVADDQEAREFFLKHDVEQYWDLARAQTILQE